MEEKGWMLITRNWAIFFGFLALLNEYIWRNYSTDHWVSFKVFGYMGITFIFIFSQVPIIMKYLIKNSTENK